ncbi:hypothetical protein AVEN_214046-1 [Araneus ventricosus]|uniref:Uncharacterized protein n=1 Tax=Araneus ventricosus TaxID=182803 RepID=A0A4Y2US41_ARAVE|nr:hypothetical protein AVEN_214046-1 [Araneus ventricosus]
MTVLCLSYYDAVKGLVSFVEKMNSRDVHRNLHRISVPLYVIPQMSTFTAHVYFGRSMLHLPFACLTPKPAVTAHAISYTQWGSFGRLLFETGEEGSWASWAWG